MNYDISRKMKILVASFMAAVGISIVGIVVGEMIFGFEKVDSAIENYMGFILIVVTAICYPFANKYLK